jgi:hypothetical protein
MSAREKSDKARRLVEGAFRDLCEVTETDMGMHPDAAVVEFCDTVQRVYRVRSHEYKELTLDPNAVIDELDSAIEALGDVIQRLDGLPFYARAALEWNYSYYDEREDNDKFRLAMAELTKDSEERNDRLEADGFGRVHMSKHTVRQNLRHDLQRAHHVLSNSVDGAIPAIRQLKPQKWKRVELVWLLWSIKVAADRLKFFEINPIRVDLPKTLKKSEGHYETFIKRVVVAFGQETVSLERNWDYMQEMAHRRELATNYAKFYADNLGKSKD